jgi:hypothetical protein
MIKNPGMRDLRGAKRRTFLKAVGALGAAYGLDRSKVLNYLFDEGGEALAGPAACASVNRSVHIVGGNGNFSWFTQLWPHLDIAATTDAGQQSTFAYYSYAKPGTLYTPQAGAGNPFYYSPDAPWVQNGVPTRPMTAFMAGQNETHTQTPTSAALLSSANSMLATVAAIQTANPVLLPVIGVQPFTFGTAPGAPAIATVPDATGMVSLFNSQASLTTLAAQQDKDLFETYYKADLGLREAAGRPTVAHYLDTPKTAAYLVGQNLSAQLTPTTQDLMNYGIPALLSSNVGSAGQEKLQNFAECLITAVKAFKAGLTNSVIIATSPGATSEQTFTDPHVAFSPSNAALLKDTVKFWGIILNAFYADLASSPDPLCSSQGLDKTTVMTFHGDTPKTPLQADAWPDATPSNANWIYVMGAGYVKPGWFGGIHADGTVDGFDPTTGSAVPGQMSSVTTDAAGAAIAWAICQGNKNIVAEYYSGGPYDGLVTTPA